ncbi:RsmD family RNA methyltransferase [Candidatus Vidania fulgoroideorum]
MKKTHTSLGHRIYYTDNIRSTKRNVRSYIFSLLNDIIKDRTFLDLFAGSGSVGIEALIHHARLVHFNDICKSHTKRIERFCKKQKITTDLQFTSLDIWKFFNTPNISTYDVIYIDPPYRMFSYIRYFLDQSRKLLNPGGLIVIETSSVIPQLASFFKKRLGITYIYLC